MKIHIRLMMLLTLATTTSLAGNLDAPGAPAAGSGMPTTADIYNRLNSGAAISVPGVFQEPAAGPTAGSGRTLSEIGSRLPAPDNVNGATAGEVVNGKTFWSLRTDGTWGLASGTIATGDSVTGANGLLSFPIPNALYTGGKTATATDSNLVAGNIKSGVSIFGVSGTASQASGTAAAADVLNGKTFSNGSATGINGAMANNGAVSITPGTSAQTIPAGYHNGSGNVVGDANLVVGNIKSGVTIFGVSGSLSALGWTHVARAICTPGWGGTNCDVCAGQWSGASCDVCPTGWSGVDCNIIAKPFPSPVPSYANTPWKCVADSASGLTWALKTIDGGLHDRNNTYTWYYSNDADPGAATVGSCMGTRGCDTAKYVTAVNGEKLCGYADWRLPSPSELRGPLFAGTPQAINLDYFPNEQASSIHWSGSSYVLDPSFAWGVNFNDGSVDVYVKTDDHYVRLVRGGP